MLAHHPFSCIVYMQYSVDLRNTDSLITDSLGINFIMTARNANCVLQGDVFLRIIIL